MPVQLGLFDIMQIDPLDPIGHTEAYERRLSDLAFADDLGFEYAFTAERHYHAHYRCPAPGVWIGAATQRTKQIRLGVLAYTLPLHSPVRLAEEIAVLDQISGGRLEVGLGLGHRVEELSANGIDPTNRIAIFQERLVIMEALWSGGQVSVASDYNNVHETAIMPLPLQQPRPPLWYAGTHQVAASWAGRRGMDLAIGFSKLDALVPAVQAFRAGHAEHRKSTDTPTGGRISLMQHVFIAESDEQAREEMLAGLTRLGTLSTGQSQYSDPAAELAQLVASDVVLAGSSETVARGIARAREALGIHLFLANVYFASGQHEQVRRTLTLLAKDVRPKLGA